MANRCPIRLGPARGRGPSAASMSLSGKRVHFHGPLQARATSLGRVSSISQDSEIASMQGLGPSHRYQRSFERQSSAPTGRDIGSKTSWVCGKMMANWPDTASSGRSKMANQASRLDVPPSDRPEGPFLLNILPARPRALLQAGLNMPSSMVDRDEPLI